MTGHIKLDGMLKSIGRAGAFAFGMLALMFVAATALAAVELEPADSVLYRSGRPQTLHPTYAECMAELESRAAAESKTRGYLTWACRQNVVARYSAEPTCPPAPAPIARVVDCPGGTTGAYTQTSSYTSSPHPQCWTQGEWTPNEPPAGACVPLPQPVDCAVSAWGAWTGSDWSACAIGTQSRQETRSRTVVTQPANGGAECPALSETRTASQSCTVEPPPGSATNLPVVCSANVAQGTTISSCAWTSQAFRPAAPDSMVRACTGSTCSASASRWRRLDGLTEGGRVEVCTQPKLAGDPVQGGNCDNGTSTWGGMAFVAPSQVVRIEVPPPSTGWTQCATEGGRCSFTGTMQVRYGAGSSWSEVREYTGGVNCTNSVFGDPVPGTVKRCEMRPLGNGVARIGWTPPTQNTDGSPLTGLRGFSIHYGEAPDRLHRSLMISDPSVTSYEVTGLPAGPWYFGVKAQVESNESALSNIASKTVQ